LKKIENSDDIDFLKGLEARIYESYSMEEINNFEKEELIERLLRKIYFEIHVNAVVVIKNRYCRTVILRNA